jgi:hypothetical protein
MEVCPYHFEEVDVWLTQPGSDSPTLFFRAVQAGCVAHGLTWMAGLFYTPGLQDAREASDPLLALGSGSSF